MNSPLRGDRPSPGYPKGRYVGHIHDRVAGREPRPAPASTPVLKVAPAAAGATPVAAANPGAPAPGRASNRRNLLITSVPLLLVAAACLFAVVKRSVIDPAVDRQFGSTSRTEARLIAGTLCARLTGTRAHAVDVSQQAAFSCRRQSAVREWDVVCDTPDGQYLLRINADTRRVYAVNRLRNVRSDAYGIGAPSGHGAMPADEAEEERLLLAGSGAPALTREQADAYARKYLRMLGVSDAGLRRVEHPRSSPDAPAGAHAGDEAPVVRGTDALWNFTYRRHVPGVGDRLLKVSINGRNGELEHVWNPVSAL